MSFSTQDTIVAIATPPGRGGIGVVRIAGPDALAVSQRLIIGSAPLQPRHATFTKIRLNLDTSARSDSLDHIVAIYFPAPHSYTGDDIVELSAHGSPVVLRTIVTLSIELGARLAEPGEFTLRAFLNGRIDLPQAEAVADLIDAVTPLQARAAFDQLDGTLTRAIAEIDAALFAFIAQLEASIDFPDEGYHFVEPRKLTRDIDALIARTETLLAGAQRGRLIREGLQVAIVGAPNVGKSSLFNALVGASRAIVADAPGTTRDLVTEVVDIEGLRVTLVDTAGLRETTDAVETEGVARSHQVSATADLVVTVLDWTSENACQTTDNKGFAVVNKCDVPGACSSRDALFVSAKTGEGIDNLRRAIVEALDVDRFRDCPGITNVRHIALVQRTRDALIRARSAASVEGGSMSEEFVLADLQEARAALEEITGRKASDELLAHIFSRFCIGK
ncbi:MAG TPA: tRNA uridine-5-carboxymethylaminomethyl(34) synthesis GTPase MnmE [Vicinamibacterales bacterium]